MIEISDRTNSVSTKMNFKIIAIEQSDGFYRLQWTQGVMADESTDIINKEQFVICIRWVDNDLHANEDFIGLHKFSVTTQKLWYLF